jgi:hypothetical protein
VPLDPEKAAAADAKSALGARAGGAFDLCDVIQARLLCLLCLLCLRAGGQGSARAARPGGAGRARAVSWTVNDLIASVSCRL